MIIRNIIEAEFVDEVTYKVLPKTIEVYSITKNWYSKNSFVTNKKESSFLGKSIDYYA